jgi:hypothetical protein
MRILVIFELYSSNDVLGISMVNTTLDLVKATEGRAFWYVVFPQKGGKMVWDESYFAKFPNLKLLTIGPDRIMPSCDHPPLDPGIYNHLYPMKFYDECYDLILNQRYCHSAEVDMMTFLPKARYYNPVKVPVVTYFTESWHDKRLPKLKELTCQISVAIGGLFGKIMTMTEYDREALMDVAKTYFSYSAQNELIKNTIVIPPAVRWDMVDANVSDYRKAREERRRKNIFNVFHGGTFESKRRLPLLARVVKKMNDRGKTNVNLVLKTQVTNKTPEFEGLAQIEYGVTRPRFIQSLAEGDIGACLSEFEGTGLAYLEMARSGMPMVFWDEPWLKGRLPESYKYVVHGESELETVLWVMVNDYNDALAESDRLIKHQHAMFDSRSVAQRMMDFFKSTVDEVREKDRKNVKKLLGWEIVMDSVEKMPETFSLDFAYDYMRANSRKGFDFRKMLKPSALRRLLIEYGYEDLCGDELPMFRRTHVKDS